MFTEVVLYYKEIKVKSDRVERLSTKIFEEWDGAPTWIHWLALYFDSSGELRVMRSSPMLGYRLGGEPT